MDRHRIENFNLSNIMLKSQSRIKSALTFNNDIIPKARQANRSMTFTSTIYDETTAEELRELLNNKSFSVLDFSSGIDDNISGLYLLKSGDISQKGGQPYYTMNITAEGLFKKYKWIISGEEIDTDWDDIVSSGFIAGTNANEGAELADTTCTWLCVNGDWTQAAEYLYCDNATRTRNIAVVVENTIGDYPATADIIIQVEATPNAADVTGGLCFRCTGVGAVSHGTAYGFGFNINDDLIYFEKFTGTGTTTLKSWNPFIKPLNHTDGTSWAYTNAYTLKVIAQGNRFDCYFDDVDGNLVFLDTVYDDTYKVGWHGVYANDTIMDFDDFSLKHAKPIVARPYVGTYDINQIRMPATSRLNDDIHSSGLSRTIVAPDNPITFRQWQTQLNDESIILDLPLNESMGTINYDNSGNTNNGAITNAQWRKEYLDNKDQWTLHFDGNGDFVHIPNDYSVDYMQSITIEVYFKPDKIIGTQTVFNKAESGNRDWELRANGADAFYLLYFVSGNHTGHYGTYFFEDTLEANEWYHMVCTFDGGTFIQSNYLNGSLLGTTTCANQKLREGQADLNLGRLYTTVQLFTGSIAFARIYRTALPATEVKQRYDSLSFNSPSGGAVKIYDTFGEDGLWDYLALHYKFDEAVGGNGEIVYDSSKNNINGTITSAVNTQATSYNKWAKTCLDFIGVNDYITLASNPDLTSDLTLIAWINKDVNATDMRIFSFEDAGDDGIFLSCLAASDKIRLGYNAINTDTTNTVLAADGWTMVVAVINKTTDIVQLYINGVANGSAIDISGQTIAVVTAGRLGINAYNLSNDYNGQMDDVMIFKKALSASRIRWLYENMPCTVIEEGYEDIQGWVEVLDKDHFFIGDAIYDNNTIRLSQYYRAPNGHATYGNPWQVRIHGYSDGMWWDEYSFWIQYFVTNGYFDDFSPLIIKKLEKHKLVLEGRGTNGADWIDYEIHLVMGSPFAMIKITDWYLEGDLFSVLQTRSFYVGGVDQGVGLAPRFTCATLDGITDAVVGGDDGFETEGLSVLFTTSQNLLALYFDESSADGWETTVVGNTITSHRNITAINFGVDTPPHWWSIGLSAFDTSLLNSNGWDDDVLTAAQAGFITINDYPAGSYRAWVYATGAAGDEDATFVITGAVSAIPATYTWTNIAAAGEWSGSIDFIADKLDDITYTVTRTGGTGAITLGELVIIPIDNSKNFPINARNHALSIEHINESVC